MRQSMKRYIMHLAEVQRDHCCYCMHRMIVYMPQKGEALPRNAQTKDHFEPRCHGGPTTSENLVLACSQCNRLRGDMDAHAFFNLLQKWFKQNPDLQERWHDADQETLKAIHEHCKRVHESYLRGRGKRSVEHAFRHYEWLHRQWHHQMWLKMRQAWY